MTQGSQGCQSWKISMGVGGRVEFKGQSWARVRDEVTRGDVNSACIVRVRAKS